MPGKIKLLIVDDSAVIRKVLSQIFESARDIEVVGSAPDPYVARDKIVKLRPDVITLDVEMPKMDGITFLSKLMDSLPIPTVIVSSLTRKGSDLAVKALEVGAIAVVAKPSLDVTDKMSSIGSEIVANVRIAAGAKVSRRPPPVVKKTQKPTITLKKTTEQILVIGSSTGGTQALTSLLPQLPADIPGTVIAQHMPPVFTKTFANRLNELCPFEVREAEDGDRIHSGLMLLAPGDFHVRVYREGAFYKVRLDRDEPVHSVRPSADVLFESVAENVGENAVGLILTGMGQDGAAGLLQMKEAGSFNIAQNKESCIVFGMPKEAIKMDAVHQIVHLDNIPAKLIDQCKRRRVS